MTWVWVGSGIITVLALAVAFTRLIGASQPASDLAGIPMTPFERLGITGLVVAGGLGVGLLGLVAIAGVDAFAADGAVRGVFHVMLAVGVGVWLVTWRRLSRPSGTTVIDERDRAIQARSFTVESMLVILSLVAWTVTLTEVFWEEGSVPLGFLQLIFWSTFILGAFGRALGIVLGYRREPSLDA